MPTLRCWSALFTLLLGVGVVVAVAMPAAAHRSLPSRRVVVQADSRGVAELWQVEVAGSDAALLWATADLDRDGKLSEAEQVRLAARVMSRAMGDVTRRCGTDAASLRACT